MPSGKRNNMKNKILTVIVSLLILSLSIAAVMEVRENNLKPSDPTPTPQIIEVVEEVVEDVVVNPSPTSTPTSSLNSATFKINDVKFERENDDD